MSYFIACVAALLKELSTAESSEYFCHICLIGNIPRKDLHFCLFQVCVCVAFENKKKKAGLKYFLYPQPFCFSLSLT